MFDSFIDVKGTVLSDVNINRTAGPIGAISSGERAFPPAIGLTFAAWVFIEKFPDPKSSKFLRLFSIQRRWISGQSRTRYSMVVFGVFLDFETKNVVVRYTSYLKLFHVIFAIIFLNYSLLCI